MRSPTRRRPRRGLRRWGMWLVGCVSCTVLATSGFGWTVVDHVDKGIGRVDVFNGVRERPRDDAALTFLLVGVDRRDGLSRGQVRALHAGGMACNCTDTIMLVHISRDRGRASVVSIPRDSYVPFPERPRPGKAAQRERRSGKINAVYAQGGPALTVQAVEQATHIHIDHYLEVDFLSFMRAVDVIGGVEVCAARQLRDGHSGLDLAPGTHHLDGAQALRYVRARHVDASSDFGRIKRQQQFLAQVMGQVSGSGTLTSPGRLGTLVDTVLGSVRADQGLRTDDLVSLGTAMRGFTPARSEFASVPVSDADYRGDPEWGSAVKWDTAKARQLFDAIREDRPLAARRPQAGAAGRVPVAPRAARADRAAARTAVAAAAGYGPHAPVSAAPPRRAQDDGAQDDSAPVTGDQVRCRG